MSDIHAILEGDERAWNAFVARYAPLIGTVVRRTLRAHGAWLETTDVVQEIFVRLLEDDARLLRRFDAKRASLRTWLSIVTRSRTIDLLRRKQYADPEQAPRPDLILLDLNMPKLDGRQVLQQMKSNPQLAVIPVVVLTTSQQEQDILQSYQLGCNSFIKKPVDVHAFIDTMISLGLYWFHLVILPRA